MDNDQNGRQQKWKMTKGTLPELSSRFRDFFFIMARISLITKLSIRSLDDKIQIYLNSLKPESDDGGCLNRKMKPIK